MPLEDLSDAALEELRSLKPPRTPLLADLIRESARRGETNANDDVEQLLRQFVNVSITKALSEYRKLHPLVAPAEHSDRSFILYAMVTLFDMDPEAVKGCADIFWKDRESQVEGDEPNWPWPITWPSQEGGGSFGTFGAENSGLWLCGYRVGKTNGLADQERQDFLDYFLREALPPVVSAYHGDQYGEPGSEERLRKMANVLAANCRNFRRNDADRYQHAISDYERDLSYLKETYYRAGMFPWPPMH